MPCFPALAQAGWKEELQLAILRREPERAEALLEQARSESGGKSPELLGLCCLWLGRAWLEAEQPQKARSFFLQSLFLAKDEGTVRRARMGLGDCHVREGKLPDALEEYERVTMNQDERGMDCELAWRLHRLSERMGDSRRAAEVAEVLNESCSPGLLGEPASEAKLYFVQLGAYASRQNAHKVVALFQAGLCGSEEARVESRPVFKVQCGSFSDVRQARRFQSDAKSRFSLDGLVIRREVVQP